MPFDDIVADADERAAILQFEGELPQADAEQMARTSIRAGAGLTGRQRDASMTTRVSARKAAR